MPISAPAGYLDVTNATLRGSQIVTTGYVGVANANPVNHLSVGSNLHVNDTASNVLQVSGNVSADRFILGGISIEPTFDLESVTNVGNVTPYTVEFRNDTLGFMTTSNVEVGGDLTVASNVEVGTANLFVDTTTGRVGVGTGSPGATLDVNGSVRISGAMSLPGLPYAFVTYGTNTSWTAFNNSILPHSSVLSQSSHNAFNTSTYKFTCPNDGVYKMTVSNLVGQNGYVHFYFRKNTTSLQPNVHLNQNNQGPWWMTMTGDYILVCSAGDELYINATTPATADIYAHPSYGYAFYQQIA